MFSCSRFPGRFIGFRDAQYDSKETPAHHKNFHKFCRKPVWKTPNILRRMYKKLMTSQNFSQHSLNYFLTLLLPWNDREIVHIDEELHDVCTTWARISLLLKTFLVSVCHVCKRAFNAKMQFSFVDFGKSYFRFESFSRGFSISK